MEQIIDNSFAINYPRGDKDDILHIITHLDFTSDERLFDLVSPSAHKVVSSPLIASVLKEKFGFKKCEGLPVNSRNKVSVKGKRYILTFLDTKYSAGSIAVLIEGEFGTALYTGYFSFYKEFCRCPALSRFVQGKQPIKYLYLDTTYYEKNAEFSGLDETVYQIIQVINKNKNKKVYIYTEKLTMDPVICELARRLKENVYVDPKRMETMKLLGYDKYFTFDASQSRVFVSKGYVKKRFSTNEEKDLIVILERHSEPTDQFLSSSETKQLCTFHFYCHSNNKECYEFIRELEPENLVRLQPTLIDPKKVTFSTIPISSLLKPKSFTLSTNTSGPLNDFGLSKPGTSKDIYEDRAELKKKIIENALLNMNCNNSPGVNEPVKNPPRNKVDRPKKIVSKKNKLRDKLQKRYQLYSNVPRKKISSDDRRDFKNIYKDIPVINKMVHDIFKEDTTCMDTLVTKGAGAAYEPTINKVHIRSPTEINKSYKENTEDCVIMNTQNKTVSNIDVSNQNECGVELEAESTSTSNPNMIHNTKINKKTEIFEEDTRISADKNGQNEPGVIVPDTRKSRFIAFKEMNNSDDKETAFEQIFSTSEGDIHVKLISSISSDMESVVDEPHCPTVNKNFKDKNNSVTSNSESENNSSSIEEFIKRKLSSLIDGQIESDINSKGICIQNLSKVNQIACQSAASKNIIPNKEEDRKNKLVHGDNSQNKHFINEIDIKKVVNQNVIERKQPVKNNISLTKDEGKRNKITSTVDVQNKSVGGTVVKKVIIQNFGTINKYFKIVPKMNSYSLEEDKKKQSVSSVGSRNESVFDGAGVKRVFQKIGTIRKIVKINPKVNINEAIIDEPVAKKVCYRKPSENNKSISPNKKIDHSGIELTSVESPLLLKNDLLPTSIRNQNVEISEANLKSTSLDKPLKYAEPISCSSEKGSLRQNSLLNDEDVNAKFIKTLDSKNTFIPDKLLNTSGKSIIVEKSNEQKRLIKYKIPLNISETFSGPSHAKLAKPVIVGDIENAKKKCLNLPGIHQKNKDSNTHITDGCSVETNKSFESSLSKPSLGGDSNHGMPNKLQNLDSLKSPSISKIQSSNSEYVNSDKKTLFSMFPNASNVVVLNQCKYANLNKPVVPDLLPISVGSPKVNNKTNPLWTNRPVYESNTSKEKTVTKSECLDAGKSKSVSGAGAVKKVSTPHPNKEVPEVFKESATSRSEPKEKILNKIENKIIEGSQPSQGPNSPTICISSDEEEGSDEITASNKITSVTPNLNLCMKTSISDEDKIKVYTLKENKTNKEYLEKESPPSKNLIKAVKSKKSKEKNDGNLNNFANKTNFSEKQMEPGPHNRDGSLKNNPSHQFKKDYVKLLKKCSVVLKSDEINENYFFSKLYNCYLPKFHGFNLLDKKQHRDTKFSKYSHLCRLLREDQRKRHASRL